MIKYAIKKKKNKSNQIKKKKTVSQYIYVNIVRYKYYWSATRGEAVLHCYCWRRRHRQQRVAAEGTRGMIHQPLINAALVKDVAALWQQPHCLALLVVAQAYGAAGAGRGGGAFDLRKGGDGWSGDGGGVEAVVLGGGGIEILLDPHRPMHIQMNIEMTLSQNKRSATASFIM